MKTQNSIFYFNYNKKSLRKAFTQGAKSLLTFLFLFLFQTLITSLPAHANSCSSVFQSTTSNRAIEEKNELISQAKAYEKEAKELGRFLTINERYEKESGHGIERLLHSSKTRENQARLYINAGKKYMEAKLYKEAIEAFKGAVKSYDYAISHNNKVGLDVPKAEVYELLAEAHAKNKSYKESAEAFKGAAYSYKDAKLHNKEAMAYENAGYAYMKAKLYEKAVWVFRFALHTAGRRGAKFYEAKAKAHLKIAEAHAKDKSYGKAAKAFESVAETYSTGRPVFATRLQNATALIKVGINLQRAAKMYKKMNKEDYVAEHLEWVLSEAGTAFKHVGELFKEEAEYLTKNLKKSNRKGKNYWYRENHFKIEEYFTFAAEFHTSAGRIFEKMEQGEKAIEMYREARKIYKITKKSYSKAKKYLISPEMKNKSIEALKKISEKYKEVSEKHREVSIKTKGFYIDISLD